MDISALKTELVSLIESAGDLAALDQARVNALGKKGRLTEMMKTLGGMDPEARRSAGQVINTARDEITALIDRQEKALRKQALEARLAAERVDVTLPARPDPVGHIHPVSRTIEELVEIFAGMGFSVAEGPDIDDDWHNFTALNFPPGHPAREMHDTFYLPDDPGETGERARKLLRTHTSTVQIRHMVDHPPPIRIIVPGRVYRSDHDMTHTPMFHQIEGLVVGEDIHFGHLKDCLTRFLEAFFRVRDLPVRFRPSFFPFTEPSAEMDIGCSRAGGKLTVGAGADWLEILGCGMVHPNVLRNCGIDPERFSGFAFGAGIDRLAMLKYGIPDLRTFFESDLRWLRHYGFAPAERDSVVLGA